MKPSLFDELMIKAQAAPPLFWVAVSVALIMAVVVVFMRGGKDSN
jgi:hypothetical protein